VSVGAILIGIALALVVGAYLARPFRPATMDLDRAIEAWVAEARAKERGSEGARERENEETKGTINYCPKCGRRVGPDDHFCAGCGAPLREGLE